MVPAAVNSIQEEQGNQQTLEITQTMGDAFPDGAGGLRSTALSTPLPSTEGEEHSEEPHLHLGPQSPPQ